MTDLDIAGPWERMGVVTAPRARSTHWLYWALAALQVADVATTWLILDHFTHVVEGNPVAAAIFGTLGLTVGCAAILAIKLAVVASLARKGTGVRLVSAIYAVVIVNNSLALVLALAT